MGKKLKMSTDIFEKSNFVEFDSYLIKRSNMSRSEQNCKNFDQENSGY